MTNTRSASRGTPSNPCRMSTEFSICSHCIDGTQKLIRQVNGAECTLCTRPFTVMRWNVAESTKTKKTLLCMTCATTKRCCQVCLLDIDYHIPTDIRDTALKMAGLDHYVVAGSDRTANREKKQLLAEKQQAQPAVNPDAHALLQQLATKLGERKLEKRQQKLAATKLPFNGSMTSPSDPKVRSFFLFGFPPKTLPLELEKLVPSASELKIVPQARCGFLTFHTRAAADQWANEIAAQQDKLLSALWVAGSKIPMRVAWAPVQEIGDYKQAAADAASTMKKLAGARKPLPQSKAKVTKPKSQPHTYKSIDAEL